jgi:hypothetical protein
MHVTFKVLDQDEQDEMLERGDLLTEAMVGWRGVADEDGRRSRSPRSAKTRMLKRDWCAPALWAAGSRCSNGRAAARKN